MKKFLFWILKIAGWKIDEHVPVGVEKCVVVVGPHTSNWDFIIGRIAFAKYGVNAKFLIKKDLFFPPLGWMLKAMGGLPVDRKQKNNLTEIAVNLFDEYKDLYLVFTPEGTRSYNPKWKKGFYYIAIKANVPIYIAYMDYSRKIGGFERLFTPTGDVEKDIADIKTILSQYKGKYPEKGIY
ncbi:MAG: 1-acyl-sn-glycerol-3-phosphate acyltransferase [Flavobacteriia bacterium]|nr:1-acyl-sn-glycerol-3-phosphate acyltransferase [Flavobacteriia bacterium]